MSERIPLEKRFWEKVNKSKADDCWEWTGCKQSGGYGQISEGGWPCKILLAHRVSWLLHYGPIPNGIQVLHHCDNPPCVNPQHLFLGTQSDNIVDMYIKGRKSHTRYVRGEDNGSSKLTEKEVLAIRKSTLNQHVLGRLYGVHHTTISLINRRKKWAWLPEEEKK